MPTIRPKQLRREAQEVASLIGQPDALEMAVINMLAFYADRTRRAPTSMTSTDAARGFGAPRPVVQALAESLSRQLELAPESRLQVAEVMWRAGYTETRELAAELLNEAGWPRITERAESWARRLEDRGAIDALAVRCLQPREGVSVQQALEPLANWLHSRSPSLHHLAMRTIEVRIKHASDESLSNYLQVLEGVLGRFHGSQRRMLRAILEDMAKRSPAETARFLMDELRRQNLDSTSTSFVKELLPGFPEPQRSELMHTLSVR